MAKVNQDTVQLWLDSETTGLTPNNGCLIELAWMCRSHYSEEGPGFRSSLVVPEHIINSVDRMTEFQMMKDATPVFVREEMHEENGLFKEIEELIVSGEPLRPYSVFSVADQILEDIRKINPGVDWKSGVVVCGSSPNFDLSWLLGKLNDSHELCRLLSHQVLDVSSLLIHKAILTNGWGADGKLVYPETPNDHKGPGIAHRALPDILQSYSTWKLLAGKNPYVGDERTESKREQRSEREIDKAIEARHEGK